MEPLPGCHKPRQGSHPTRAVRASDAGHTSQSDHACTTGEDAREHTFEHSTAAEQFGPVHAGGWSAGRQMNARYFFVSRAVVCAVWLAFALPVSATPTPSNPSQPAVKPVAAAAVQCQPNRLHGKASRPLNGDCWTCTGKNGIRCRPAGSRRWPVAQLGGCL